MESKNSADRTCSAGIPQFISDITKISFNFISGSKNGHSRSNSRTENHSPHRELKSPTKVVEENNISTLESVTVETQPLNQKA